MSVQRAAMRALRRRAPTSVALGFSVLLLVPGESLAAAVVRFVHAVPSAGKVTVELSQGGSDHSVGSVGFGQVTPWQSIRSGQFGWALVSGGTTLAHGTATVSNGAYDLVFLAKPAAGVSLGIYKARSGQPGTALVRVIHAAPELGTPQLRVDSKRAVPSLSFTQATSYLPLSPGVHTLSANPEDSTVPLISVKAPFVKDEAYSEIVVGSNGQRVRVVSLVDRGAPATQAAASGTQNAVGASSPDVTVQPGDSLWQIARDRLAPASSDESVAREVTAIWDLNAQRIGTGDPNLIFPGQHLTLPTT